MAAWIWSSMAGAVPARAPPRSISPSPIGASSRAARLLRRKSRSAWNPRKPRQWWRMRLLSEPRPSGSDFPPLRHIGPDHYPGSGPAPMKYLLILLGGGAGSLARYLAGSALTSRFGTRFPTGTMVVNVTGCFLIGLTMTLLTERLQPHPYWRLVLVVGFFGGYTTFSSFEWETYSAVREGGFWIGLANIVGSVGLGYTAVWLGALLARR